MIAYFILQREYLVYWCIYKISKIKDAVQILRLTVCGYKLLIYSTFKKFHILISISRISQHNQFVTFDSRVNSPLCVSFCRFVVERNLATPIRSVAVLLFFASIHLWFVICWHTCIYWVFGYIIKIFIELALAISDRSSLHQLNK